MVRLTVSNCILHIRTVDWNEALEYSRRGRNADSGKSELLRIKTRLLSRIIYSSRVHIGLWGGKHNNSIPWMKNVKTPLTKQLETPDAYLPKSVYKRNAPDSKRVGICFRLLSKLNWSIHFYLAMFFILFSVLGKSLQM